MELKKKSRKVDVRMAKAILFLQFGLHYYSPIPWSEPVGKLNKLFYPLSTADYVAGDFCCDWALVGKLLEITKYIKLQRKRWGNEKKHIRPIVGGLFNLMQFHAHWQSSHTPTPRSNQSPELRPGPCSPFCSHTTPPFSIHKPKIYTKSGQRTSFRFFATSNSFASTIF